MEICHVGGHYHARLREIRALCAPATFLPVGRCSIHVQPDFNCGVFADPDLAFGRAALAACNRDHALTVAGAEASGVVFPDGMRDGKRHALLRAMAATFGSRHVPSIAHMLAGGR